MRSTHRTRDLSRTGTAAVAVVALAGLALAVPAPAQAAGAVGTFGVSADAGSSGGTCSDVTDKNVNASFTSNGATLSKSTSLSGTISDSGDAGDTATVAASSKATFRATESDGSFAAATFAATLSASVTAAQGSASSCDANTSASAGIESLVTLTRPGWLTVSTTAPRGFSAILQIVNSTSTGGMVVAAYGDETSFASTAWLDAGTYQMYATAGTGAGIPGSGDPSKSSGAVKITATMAAAGAAAGPAAGSGGKYVSFAGSRNCNDNTVAVTFAPPAKDLAKATFFVNGKQKATIANPPAGVSMILSKLTDDQAASVKAVLVPATKKGKKPKPVTVTRSYRACS